MNILLQDQGCPAYTPYSITKTTILKTSPERILAKHNISTSQKKKSAY